MKKSILLPLSGGLIGLSCFLLRIRQNAAAIDPETLLYIPNAPETIQLVWLMAIFAVVMATTLFLGGRSLPNYQFTTYNPNAMFMAVVVVSGFLLLISTLVGVMDLRAEYEAHQATVYLGNMEKYSISVTSVIYILGAGLAGFALIYLGKAAYHGEELASYSPTIIPAALSVVLVVKQYRTYGALPSVQESFYPVFGSMILCLALYQISVTAYIKPKPKMLAFYSLVSCSFTGVILASETGTHDKLLQLSLTIFAMAFTGSALENTYATLETYRTPPEFVGEKLSLEQREALEVQKIKGEVQAQPEDD